MAFRSGERSQALFGLFVIWTGMAGVFMCLAGILILGWQVYVFLKFGTWLSKPLLGLVLEVVDSNASWLVKPQSYPAVHVVLTSILSFIPLSMFLIAAGLTLIAAAHAVGGRPPMRRHWEDGPRLPNASDDWFGRN